MREDFLMWQRFLMHPTVYCRPFADFKEAIVADELDFYTDASGRIGFGGLCGKSYMHMKWSNRFLSFNPSIAYQELFAVVACVLAWIERFKNHRVILFCDNKSVVDMINSNSSNCKNCMVLIRILVLKGLTENVRIFSKHLTSSQNIFADLLSRDRVDECIRLRRKQKVIMERQATPVPDTIWPVEKIWKF